MTGMAGVTSVGSEHGVGRRCTEARVLVDEAPDDTSKGAVGVGERFEGDGECAESGGESGEQDAQAFFIRDLCAGLFEAEGGLPDAGDSTRYELA